MNISEISFEHSTVRVTLRTSGRDDGMYVKVFIGGFAPVTDPPWPDLQLDTLGPYDSLKDALDAGGKYARTWIESFKNWRGK